MKLYIDLIWLLNFLFDSFLLYATGFLLKRELVRKRIVLAGFVGSLAIFSPFLPWHVFASPPMKILLSFTMVLLAFGYRKLSYFLTNVGFFYLTAFVSGGALLAVHYLLRFDYRLDEPLFLANVRGGGDPVSWLYVLIGFPLVLRFSRSSIRRFEAMTINYRQLVPVTVELGPVSLALTGLIDSGNQLYEPITKRPVMIISLEKCKSAIPGPLLSVLADPDGFFRGETALPEEWLERIAIIPYRVVGQEERWLLGVKPDGITLILDGKSFQTANAIAAFVPQNLAKDGKFDCLVHPKMADEAMKRNVSRHSPASVMNPVEE